MSDVAILATFAGLVVLALAYVIRSLLAANKVLTHALVAQNATELTILERADRPALRVPFVGGRPSPIFNEDDDDEILPMGLAG